MANDNVKIVIQEVDETQPRGSGASSDIAYVPGLAYPYEMSGWDNESGPKYAKYEAEKVESLAYEDQVAYELQSDGYYYRKLSRNKPILCSTISEFEYYFGKYPYVMSQRDIRTAIENTYNVNDYDKSYIYAKELINAGMSVVYENITAESGAETVAVVDYIKQDTDLIPLTSRGNGTFRFATDSATECIYTFKFDLGAGLPMDSGAKILCDCSDSDVKVELVEFTSDEKVVEGSEPSFNISENVVTWGYIEETQFKYTKFELKVKVSYEGSVKKETTFAINVVSTDSVGTDCVCGSKIEYLYSALPDSLNRLKDKNEYSIKYVTSGGYPTFIPVIQEGGTTAYSLADMLIDCATQRGDAVALVDHIDNPDADLNPASPESIFFKVNDYFGTGANNEFGAMFTPWGRYSCVTVTDINRMSQILPASFGYLMCVANAIKTSPNWLAMAGVARGIVPNLKELHTNQILSNVIAEEYQPKYGKNTQKVSINAITNVKPYGLTIWGNRTMDPIPERGAKALNFLNTRNMISDIKKLAYSTAKALMFEQDSDTLWLRFKSGVSPLLDQLKSGYGISNYKIIKGTTKYNGQALTRGEMAAVIKIYPLYAIEYFEITVVIADDDVAVS